MGLALQDSTQFRAVIDALPTHVWVALPDGSTKFHNKAWLDYVGFDAEQAQGLGWKDAIHPDDVEPYVAKWMAIKESKAPGEAEARFRRFDGQYRWFLMRVAPMLDTHGQVIRWYGTNTDIEDRKQSEQSCRASERRMLEGIPALVALMSPLGEVQLVNSQVLQYFNKSLEELKGWRTGDWLHPEDLPQVVAAWTRSVQSGERYDIEHRMRRADGVYRWFHVCGLPLRDAEGRTVNWLVLQIDVDDRRTAEDALRVSEERYARAMEGSDAGHWDWNMLTDEMFISERAREILGLHAGPLPTRRADVVAMVQEHPDDRLTEQQVRLSTLSGRHEREFRVISRPHDVRWLRTRGKVYKDARGTAIRMTGSLTDITESKRAQEALRASQERFALAIAASNDGIWDWNLLTDHQFFSERAQRIFGLEPGPTVRRRADWHKLREFHPDDAGRRLAALERHLAGDTPAYEGEWRVRPIGGEYRWVRTRGVCVRDAAGAPTRMVGSITDIDASKRAQEALRDSEGRYALAMQASGEGHWDWKIASDEFYASARWREISGFEPDEDLGGRAAMLARYPFHPDDRPKYEAAVAEHFAGKTRRLEMELRITPRGELRWAKFTAMCLRDAAGGPMRWAGSIMDITEQKRATEALRESEQRYERAMAAAEVGFWDWHVPTDALYVSPKLLEIAGLPAGSKYTGRDDFMRRVHRHPDDEGKWVNGVKELFAGSGSRLTMETRLLVADETRWLHLNGVCARDASGRVERWTGSVTDVTARKRAEQALLVSENRYERAMEGSDAGHWDWNLVTDEMFVSERAREMLALPVGPLPTRRDEIMALVPQHPDDRTQMVERVRSSIQSGIHEREYRVIPNPGEVRWLRSRGKVYKDTGGAAIRMTGSITDITERKLAAEAVRVSEERYALALQATDEGHFDIDLETGAAFVSERLKELFGHAPGAQFANRVEFIARAPLHPEDRERIEQLRQDKQPNRKGIEFRVLPRPGEVRWLSARYQTIVDSQGKPKRRIGVVTDITERKLAAEAVRVSEERYARAMEATEAGHWEWDLVTNQVFHSARFRELYGIGIEEEFASRDEWKVRHPVSGAQRERQKRALYEAIADPTKRYDMEVSFELSPGHVRWLRSRGKVFRDENGRPLRVVGTTIDITARKRAEEALRSRTEMLELAQKSARAVAFDWRAELEEGWPPELEAMYGVAPGTWPGSFRPFGLQRQDWKKVVHPDDWAAVTEAIEHAHRTGEVVAEYRVIHADGSVHWLQSKGEMFFDADRNPVRMVGLIQDVTPLRHAEEELNAMERKLRQAQRLEAMGTLAGGIAHDFNNILGAILGYGEMALRDAAKGTRLRRDLESIVTAGERGRALIDRILAFSRSSVGERMAVHVEKVVGEALDLISGKLPPNVAVNAELHAGSAAILGDATQVHQVLMNLATNAIQAMSSGGTLRISLRTARMERGRMPTIGTIAASDYLVLEVADTGAGIPPEIAERIFDPFFTTKQTGTGTGLGLALVHGIVTGLDGAIDVASTPGAGTTFTVYLPRSGDAMESVAEREAEVPRGEGQRVLVVDDEEPLVRLAARTLEELGYVPTGFTSSAAALAAFRGDPHGFDAVITDERMPGLSGSALIRQMRGLRPSMPIMLMSGYIGGNVSSQAWEAGADEVLKKPLTARTLATTLARVLR